MVLVILDTKVRYPNKEEVYELKSKIEQTMAPFGEFRISYKDTIDAAELNSIIKGYEIVVCSAKCSDREIMDVFDVTSKHHKPMMVYDAYHKVFRFATARLRNTGQLEINSYDCPVPIVNK